MTLWLVTQTCDPNIAGSILVLLASHHFHFHIKGKHHIMRLRITLQRAYVLAMS